MLAYIHNASPIAGASSASTPRSLPFSVKPTSHSGGSNSSAGDIDGSTGAILIDINGPVPFVKSTAPMPVGLQWHTATVIADGRVVVTGGALKNNRLAGMSSAAYLWDPRTGAWTQGAVTRSGRARLYHSTALLLQDGSVLVAGRLIRVTGARGAICHIIRPEFGQFFPDEKPGDPMMPPIRLTTANAVTVLNAPEHWKTTANKNSTAVTPKSPIAK